PVVQALVAGGAQVSVDTMRAAVADAALAAGASVINDVSGGQADADMPAVIAERGSRYVVSHWRGHYEVMTGRAVYTDVTEEVLAELGDRVQALRADGVRTEQIVLDPGLGFAKDAEHNWRLLADLDQLVALGRPVLTGASRKRFLGQLLADAGSESLPAFRGRATAAVSALAAVKRVWAARAHDVAGRLDASRVAPAWGEGENER